MMRGPLSSAIWKQWLSDPAGRGGSLLTLAVLVGLLAPGQAMSQQAGSITGTVSDVATGQMLESALVTLDGAQSGVLTTDAGRYLMLGVSAGTHEVTFDILGYETRTLTVEVAAGETIVLNAELVSGALALQELVVTGGGPRDPQGEAPVHG